MTDQNRVRAIEQKLFDATREEGFEETLSALVGMITFHMTLVCPVCRENIAKQLKKRCDNGPDRFNKFCYGFAQALKDKVSTVTHGRFEDYAKLQLWYETNGLCGGKLRDGTSLSMGRASSEAGLAAGRDASLHRGALGQPMKRIGHDRGKLGR